jgi:hypothetical protein
VFRKKQIRQLFEGRTREAMAHGTDTAGYRRGCLAFLEDFHAAMGVAFEGRPTYAIQEATGRPYKVPGTASADEVSVRALAEAICGHDFVEEYYNPDNSFDFGTRALTEAALDPTAFVNVNVFNLSVAGLVNAQIIERFQLATRIGPELVTIKPTNMNGQKLIGSAGVGAYTKEAKKRYPGRPHMEVGFGEVYQTTPETLEQALKVLLTKEVVFFDITGKIIEEASEVGDELGYGMEKDILDGVAGVNNSYNFLGTSYNTYQTASPWINDQSNAFTDWTSWDKSRLLFVGRTDPVTGKEIQVDGRDILIMPQRESLWHHFVNQTAVQRGTQNTGGNFPGVWNVGPTPTAFYGNPSRVLSSQILFNRATAADGLSLSSSNATEYWWHGDFKKAFWWMENWPLTPWQASADELTMKDRGLVGVYGANYRGVFYTKEPRFVNRNKN